MCEKVPKIEGIVFYKQKHEVTIPSLLSYAIVNMDHLQILQYFDPWRSSWRLTTKVPTLNI